MRKQLIIGAVISLACLYFAFRGLSLGQVWASLQTADLRWIAVAVAVYSASFYLRAYRWSKLMNPIKPATSQQLLRPMIIGFFANNVLPFRMGEIVRAHMAGKRLGISRSASLGTILLERICDTISFLSIFLIVAFFFPFPNAIRHAAFVLGVTCFGIIAFLLFASKHQHRTHVLIEKLPLSPRWQEKIQHTIVNFSQGISGITQIGYMAQALALSMVVWTIEGTVDYLIAHAFPVHITYPQAFFLLFFLGLSVTLPQAPGYVGTVELFGVLALSLLGVPKNLGLSIVLTIHGTQFIYILALGVWALWKEKLSLSGLMHQET
jgi:uncharacterized protein (TIRG00374 family)